MIACIIFVFGALLEYTVILLKLKLKKVRASKRESRQQNGSTNVENETLVANNGKSRSRKKSATSGILNWIRENVPKLDICLVNIDLLSVSMCMFCTYSDAFWGNFKSFKFKQSFYIYHFRNFKTRQILPD